MADIIIKDIDASVQDIAATNYGWTGTDADGNAQDSNAFLTAMFTSIVQDVYRQKKIDAAVVVAKAAAVDAADTDLGLKK